MRDKNKVVRWCQSRLIQTEKITTCNGSLGKERHAKKYKQRSKTGA